MLLCPPSMCPQINIRAKIIQCISMKFGFIKICQHMNMSVNFSWHLLKTNKLTAFCEPIIQKMWKPWTVKFTAISVPRYHALQGCGGMELQLHAFREVWVVSYTPLYPRKGPLQYATARQSKARNTEEKRQDGKSQKVRGPPIQLVFILSRVRGSMTNNNGFWIDWLIAFPDTLFTITLYYNQLWRLTINDCLRLASFLTGLRVSSLLCDRLGSDLRIGHFFSFRCPLVNTPQLNTELLNCLLYSLTTD
jgi:hypothetical protein